MPTASTPGAPLLARTFSHASNTRRLEISNDFTLGSGRVLGSSPAGLASVCPWSARPLRSGPITGPSPLLRAGPPLCPGSVLCPNRLPPTGVLPLAGRAAQLAHPRQVGTATTGSPVPCQRLRRAHATYTPDTTRPARRPPPGSQHTTTIGCAFIPGTPDNPGFDAIVLFFRCVSSGSHTFVFSSPTRPADSGPSTATLTTPALNRRSLRWFERSACTTHPKGQPPSPAQHVSLWRSSTSSSLHFQDTL